MRSVRWSGSPKESLRTARTGIVARATLPALRTDRVTNSVRSSALSATVVFRQKKDAFTGLSDWGRFWAAEATVKTNASESRAPSTLLIVISSCVLSGRDGRARDKDL